MDIIFITFYQIAKIVNMKIKTHSNSQYTESATFISNVKSINYVNFTSQSLI